MLRTLLRTASVWLACSGPVVAETVTVFAAASLRDALQEVAEGFEAETGHQLVASYAGSSTLARQIGFGAPADLFISANTDWMDWLEGRGHLVAGSRVDLLGNRLVLATRDAGSEIDIAELPTALGDGRLAMALVDAVPAGIYGKAALQHLGVWDMVQPEVVQTDNVRAALALVALGEAGFGVVYATDALAEPRILSTTVFPSDSHPPITYPAARIKDTNATQRLMAYLQSPAAQAVFARHGFLTPGVE